MNDGFGRKVATMFTSTTTALALFFFCPLRFLRSNQWISLLYTVNIFLTFKGGHMAAKKKRKPNAAFMKPVQPDAALSAVVGNQAMPRTEITKKLWAYIKKNRLQDEKKKTNINADDKLQAVFGGKKTVTMFEMTKLVSRHVG
jgi:chromatin remodeling complex protein RSC6